MPFFSAPIKKAVDRVRESACVPKEEFESRFAVCESCENFDSQLNVCKHCGCYMRWKAQLKLARCPDGRW